jgi:molybdopterin-guanine dinucleotide biosynthesis protein A
MRPRERTSSGFKDIGRDERHESSPGEPAIEKGLLTINGQPLAARASAFLRARTACIFISANQQLGAYDQYGVVVPDDPAFGADAGPLAGIASVLPRVNTEWLAVVPVDVVSLPDDLIDRLAQQATAASGLAAYARGARDQPLCAIIHRSLAADLRDYLLNGERKVLNWLQRIPAAVAAFDADPMHFYNINTPEDLCRAQHWLASGGGSS